MFKNWKGYRTLLVAGAIAALGTIQAAGLATIVPAPYVGYALLGIGALIAGLRTISDTPVASSEPKVEKPLV